MIKKRGMTAGLYKNPQFFVKIEFKNKGFDKIHKNMLKLDYTSVINLLKAIKLKNKQLNFLNFE
jgi:hypothetical protein